MKTIIYNKLLLQAQEAKLQGFHRLAGGIFQAIGDEPEDISVDYSREELQKDVHNGLWKLVNNIIEHYQIESVDAEKIDEFIDVFSSDFIEQLEALIDVDSKSQEDSEEDYEEKSNVELDEEDDEEDDEDELDFSQDLIDNIDSDN